MGLKEMNLQTTYELSVTEKSMELRCHWHQTGFPDIDFPGLMQTETDMVTTMRKLNDRSDQGWLEDGFEFFRPDSNLP